MGRFWKDFSQEPVGLAERLGEGAFWASGLRVGRQERRRRGDSHVRTAREVGGRRRGWFSLGASLRASWRWRPRSWPADVICGPHRGLAFCAKLLRQRLAARLGLDGAGALPAPSSTEALGAEPQRFTEAAAVGRGGAGVVDRETRAREGKVLAPWATQRAAKV